MYINTQSARHKGAQADVWPGRQRQTVQAHRTVERYDGSQRKNVQAHMHMHRQADRHSGTGTYVQPGKETSRLAGRQAVRQKH